jgi:two-component sensor histidine kinase
MGNGPPCALIDDETLAIVDCNDALAQRLARPREDLSGSGIASLFHERAAGEIARVVAALREAGQTEASVPLSDGTLVGLFAWRFRRGSVWSLCLSAPPSGDQKLLASLRERDALLAEVHHRLTNNLQIIASLLSAQIGRLGEGSARHALLDCQTRVLAVSLLHQQLRPSRAYRTVDLAEYVRALVPTIARAVGRSESPVSLELELEPISLGVAQAVSCGLVLNELVTNALEHAFEGRDGGTVRVGLRAQDQGRVALSVWDDGVGLGPDIDLARAQTMGLSLVHVLAQQLGAEIEVRRGGGTIFTLTFAAAP